MTILSLLAGYACLAIASFIFLCIIAVVDCDDEPERGRE